MNNNFKKLNGKIKHLSENKNFSVYGQTNNLSDAMKIANEFHKQKNKKYKELFLSQEKLIDEKEKIDHPTFELSDDELKRRIEISKMKNDSFKEIFDQSSSISDILNNIRIEKAKELLRDPSLRIGDIADMVGFLDMAHFSRVFKKQTGVSANEYRNSLK
jgi:YesN/AraC family two-component response regulator